MADIMELYSKATGSGKPVLLIHGIIQDYEYFSGFQDISDKAFQMISYNRRGYGLDSGFLCRDYSLKTQAEDAVSVLRRYTDEPAYIVGDSTGGAIAVQTAVSFPELVRGIFLVESVIPCKGINLSCLDAWKDGVQHIIETGNMYRMVPLFAKLTGIKPVTKNTKLKNIEITINNIRNFIYGEADTVMQFSFPCDEVRKIFCPVVMGISTEGKELSFGRGAKETADFYGWKTTYLPGHHNTIQDYPEDFFCQMKKFIESVEGDDL